MESRLTERQFFALSLTGILVLVLGLYLFILRPRMLERARLRAKIESKSQQLEQTGFFLGEASLLRKKRGIETEYQALVAEWDLVTGRLAAFDRENMVDVAKIDYKWYLYLTRDRLRKKAGAQNIEVPALLGLPDTIESDDIARELMLQLLAVEKLVDTSIEFGIADIRSIDPLPPVKHRVDEASEVYMEEYPLRVIFEGDMRRLYRLWEAMFQPGRAMMLRNIAMEKTSLREPDEVRMTATLSSFLFLKDAESVSVLRKPPKEKTAARGH
jgi:hypothetical protein